MITNTHLSTAGVRLVDLPIDVAVQRILNSAADLNAAVKKTPRHEQSFGDQLIRAVHDRLPSAKRAPVIAETEPQESFGQQIKKAMERNLGGLPTQKQHKEQAERERSRYPQPRKRAKGE
jgi:hypothetical protein